MAALKFLYYNQRQSAQPTLSNNHNIKSELPMEEVKRRFRRSGSVGMPFIPEDDMRSIKSALTIDEDSEEGEKTITIIVKTSNATCKLEQVMKALPDNVRIKHVESRDPKSKSPNEIEVFLELCINGDESEIIENVVRAGFEVTKLSQTYTPCGAVDTIDPGSTDALSGAVWFPKCINDLDICSKRVIMYGSGLDADHPGFKDDEYRKRRMMFADVALNYRQGDPIPKIDYTESERATWKIIYRKLRELHKKHACSEFLNNFGLLEQHCGYAEDNIPQLENISNFLKKKTGFRLRPVAGYLSARDFLAGLAFRVFNCTQYIRHHADPFYTPEPDTVHELMGHMALFAEPDFAQFSQEIGLASLGASEEDLKKLATLYFFSIEFGLCSVCSSIPNDQIPISEGLDIDKRIPKYKAYGAGLLSSAGELQFAVSDKAEIIRFDPDRVIQQECLITTFQAAYFYTQSFDEAQQKLRTFTNSINRPFVVRYNPYTESIEVLNNKRSLMLAVNLLQSDINLVTSALRQIL